MSSAVDEAPFIAAESGLSSQGKPQRWKVISFQRGVAWDSSMPLPGTRNAPDGYSSGQPRGDNIHTHFQSLWHTHTHTLSICCCAKHFLTARQRQNKANGWMKMYLIWNKNDCWTGKWSVEVKQTERKMTKRETNLIMPTGSKKKKIFISVPKVKNWTQYWTHLGWW